MDPNFESIFEKICVYIEETLKIDYDYKRDDFELVVDDNKITLENWNLIDIPKPDLSKLKVDKVRVDSYKTRVKEREKLRDPMYLLEQRLKKYIDEQIASKLVT